MDDKDLFDNTQDGGAAPQADEPSSDENTINEPSEDEDITDEPSADDSAEELDTRELMRQLVLSVQGLTDELRQIRTQLAAGSRDAAGSPGEIPSVSAAGEAESGSPEKEAEEQSEKKKPKKNKALSIISTLLFYAVIVAMVLGAFLMRSTAKGEPFMVAGFSAANVLTSSMEDVYPRGSLIIAKQVDATELQIGDDITFMVGEDSSITHRIIGITENYQDTGARAFQTQGTKNPNPDKEMVAAANVVGKVIFHSKELGDFANFTKENWPILLFVLIVIIGLITFLKWNAKKSDGDDSETEDKPKEKKKSSRKKKKDKDKDSERGSESDGDE